MTTVVYSRKHKKLLADRQIGTPITDGTKIFSAGTVPSMLLTGAGYYDDLAEVARWLATGHSEDSKPQLPDRGYGKDSDFVLVNVETGDAWWMTYPYLRQVPIEEEFYTLGTGGQYALGALLAGATPEKAMQIAASLDPYTGEAYDVHNLGVRPRAKRSR